ncbi:MAG TPA: DUF1385 domain-containing protein [Firmicutes bacterium]|nr:DUF1385 domain-containing protein [Bacillota bacterium]
MAKREKVLKKTSIGGQALIEGIMMRGPEKTAMAVRHVSGEIVMEEWPTSGSRRAKFWKLPLIRGVYNFVDSMYFGYKCLMRSAELSGLEDEEESSGGGEAVPPERRVPAEAAAAGEETAADGNAGETGETRETVETAGAALTSAPAAGTAPAAVETPPETAAGQPETAPVPPVGGTAAVPAQAPARAEKKEAGDEGFLAKFGMTLLMVVSSVLGVLLAIGLFLYLPSLLFNLLMKIEALQPLNNQIWRAVFEGVLRIVLFVGYLAAVSLMKDIRRVFQYHGAEHKCIFCYEKGLPLTVENVREQIRFHPRCGTSFMILMLIVGIVISMFIPIQVPILRTLVKLLTIPLIVGIGYELIKWAGRSDSLVVRIISAPGLWLQRLTTKEPDDSMIEVAVAALNRVIPEDPDADRL